MGRPSKLTDENKEKILKAIEAGMSQLHAAHFAGVTERTLQNWIAAGKKAKSGKYFQFFQDLNMARAKGVAFHCMIINNEAKNGNWHASKFMLQMKGYGKDEESLEALEYEVEDMDISSLLEQVNQGSEQLRLLAPPVIDLDEE